MAELGTTSQLQNLRKAPPFLLFLKLTKREKLNEKVEDSLINFTMNIIMHHNSGALITK